MQQNPSQHEYVVEIAEREGPPTSRVYRSALPVTERQVLADLENVVVTKITEPARPGKPGKLDAKRPTLDNSPNSPGPRGLRVNPWMFLTVVIVVAGVVAAFGIYWGFRDNGLDNEQARARAAAEQVASLCKGGCTVTGVERIARGLWRTREVDKGGKAYCATIDLRYFRVTSTGKTVDGIGLVRCPK